MKTRISLLKILFCISWVFVLTNNLSVQQAFPLEPGAVNIPDGFLIKLPFRDSAKVSRGYGEAEHNNTDVKDRSNDYYALDFNLTRNTSVLAIARGTVIYAGWTSSDWSPYGQIVILDHPTIRGHFQSLYAHLEKIAVKVGQEVPQGNEIGLSGSSSNRVTGLPKWEPHLHFALYQDAQHVGDGEGKTGGPYGGNAALPEPISGHEEIKKGQDLRSGNTPPNGCPPITAWKGEYWNNQNLDGNPVLCRDDGSVDFDWGNGRPGGDVPTDHFSARWTRQWSFTAGRYRFHLRGDDGIRLRVDDTLIIDQWKDQGRTEYTTERELTGGNHSLKVEYYENGGDANVALWWDSISTITEWKGEYWNNQNLDGNPVLVRDDRSVDFDWGDGGPGGGVPTDHFSARWTRQWNFTAGRYRFHLRGDDGIRLWVGDTLIIDQWKDQSRTEYTTERELTGGNYNLKVEYYENGGGANVALWWDSIVTPCPTITEWKGEYWNNQNLNDNLVLCRDDRSVDFDWGNGDPGGGVSNDHFSARWTRQWNFTAGRYRFHLRGDDGIRLWVDDNLIIDQWKDQGRTEYTTERELTGGSHSLKVEYYENGGEANVALWWDSIGGPQDGQVLKIDPSTFDSASSGWDQYGPSYEGNPVIADFGATHTHAYGYAVGQLTYHFSLSDVAAVTTTEISARLSSEFPGYSAPPDGYSDVTLILNGKTYESKRVIPDNGSGRTYTWQIRSADLRQGDNTVSFAVDANASYRNGLCIYYKGVAGAQDEPIKIQIGGKITKLSSDVNGDGKVDIFDLALVAKAFGTSGEGLPADVNGDKKVDIFDVVMVAVDFGKGSKPAAPVASQVPSNLSTVVIEKWLAEARAADDGSELFRRGIAVLESLLNAIVPEKTALFPNYPNPFNPETWIPYQLNEASEVTITIYDMRGRAVKRLDLGYQQAGLYRMRDRAAYWDGRNEVGEPVASGVYFVELRTKKYQQTRRIVLLK